MNILRFVTIYPNIIIDYCRYGVFNHAIKSSKLKIDPINLRNFGCGTHLSVDYKPYGHQEGMIIRADVLKKSIANYIDKELIITTNPCSDTYYNQSHQKLLLNKFLQGKNLIFICGRFSGIDQRFIDKYVDYHFSLGDFVISGGELPCLMIAESIVRAIPGVINQQSLNLDSFSQGLGKNTKQHPLYTKPLIFEGIDVPKVLLGGNHSVINRWKKNNLKDKKNLR